MQLTRSKNKVEQQNRVRTDEELWHVFQTGSDSAYTVLYNRYADRLYSYLKLLLTNSAEHLSVDDLFQETWLRVFRERERFTVSEGGTFAGWLFRIAHNLTISSIRKQHPTSPIEELEGNEEFVEAILVQPVEQDVVDGLTTEDLMRHVEAAVETLPLMLKEVFVLSEFDRLSLDQIAEALGITKTNAKVRLFRARRAIREYLERVLKLNEWPGSVT